jgi:elongation factor Ts
MAYASVVDGTGVIVEVNAESDFVAKNDLFVDYVLGVSTAAANEAPADIDALYACRFPGTNDSVLETQNAKVLVIGENIKIRRFARIDTGLCVPYVHMGGRIAVLMNLDVDPALMKDPEVFELGKDLAMQVAALKPTFLDKSDVSEAFIEDEKKVRLIQAKEDPKNASKPEALLEKIVMGSISKYYKEICLLQQPFVKDDKVSVEQHVADIAKKLGTKITVKSFIRYERGEGLEKKECDLAAEVAELIK